MGKAKSFGKRKRIFCGIPSYVKNCENLANAATDFEDRSVVETINTQPESNTFVEIPTDDKSKIRQYCALTDKREEEQNELLQHIKKTFKPSDEYSAFGKFVGHKIRKLSSERLRGIAENRINNILSELEMSEENRNPAMSSNSALTSLPVVKPGHHHCFHLVSSSSHTSYN